MLHNLSIFLMFVFGISCKTPQSNRSQLKMQAPIITSESNHPAVSHLVGVGLAKRHDGKEINTVGTAEIETFVTNCSGMVASHNQKQNTWLILTARHCLDMNNGTIARSPEGLFHMVYFNDPENKGEPIILKVIRSKVFLDHMDFDSDFDFMGQFFDIGWLEVKGNIPSRLVPASVNSFTVSKNTPIYVAGYGLRDRNLIPALENLDNITRGTVATLIKHYKNKLVPGLHITKTSSSEYILHGDSGSFSAIKLSNGNFAAQGIATGSENHFLNKQANCENKELCLQYVDIFPFIDWIESTSGYKIKTNTEIGSEKPEYRGPEMEPFTFAENSKPINLFELCKNGASLGETREFIHHLRYNDYYCLNGQSYFQSKYPSQHFEMSKMQFTTLRPIVLVDIDTERVGEVNVQDNLIETIEGADSIDEGVSFNLTGNPVCNKPEELAKCVKIKCICN